MLSLQEWWTVQDRSVLHVESTGVVDSTGQERVAC